MSRRYIRIEPTRERVSPKEVIKRLQGLWTIERSKLKWINPRHTRPRFELLILTKGGGEEIKFLFAVDKERHLKGLKSELVAAFPDSYDIYEVSASLRAELTPTEYPAGDEDQNPLDAVTGTPEQYSDDLPDTVDDPTIDDFDDSTLKSIRWYGIEDRRGDWMTTLKEFEEQIDEDEENVRAPLSSAIENLSQIDVPIALQVLWARRDPWERKAERRKNNIRTKHDGVSQTIATETLDRLGGYSREERRERHRGGDVTSVGESASDHEKETGTSVRSRSALIDRKDPNRSFIANIRATALIPDKFPNGIEEKVEEDLTALSNAFNLVDGPFYRLEGKLVDKSMFHGGSSRDVFEKIINREISRTAIRTKRPQIILSADELANFVAIPSLQALTREGARGTRGEGKYRTPLELPDPDKLDQFMGEGVELTHPLDQRRQTYDKPVRVPFNSLNEHFTIAAQTGGGKSKLTQSILRSLAAETQGPNIVFNPKDDYMLENYMRIHYDEFGSLDDILYFDVGETLPCIPFFDIRPMLAAGKSRADAIEIKKRQFKDIMVQAMGESRYDQAFVGVTILNLLIEALFDPIHGDDAFRLHDLRESLNLISDEGRIPDLSPQFQHVEDELTRYYDQSDHAEDSFEAAENRLAVIANQHNLRKFFNQLPEWDDERGCYADDGFHFQELLDTDKTILFDIGSLHKETQRVVVTVILNNIWDAVQFKQNERGAYDTTPENYSINPIIDEAADLASTPIVTEEFIPQGRGYDVGLGLIEQFPDQIGESHQVESQDENRAYRELLTNVHTMLIGNIAITERQAELFAHEGIDKNEVRKRISDMAPGHWYTVLPSKEYFENPPKPFYSQSPSIPSGHPESDDSLSEHQERQFRDGALKEVIQRTKRNYSTSPTHQQRSRSTPASPADGEDSVSKEVDPGGANISGMFTAEANAPDNVTEDSSSDTQDTESDGGTTSSTSPSGLGQQASVGDDGAPADSFPGTEPLNGEADQSEQTNAERGSKGAQASSTPRKEQNGASTEIRSNGDSDSGGLDWAAESDSQSTMSSGPATNTDDHAADYQSSPSGNGSGSHTEAASQPEVTGAGVQEQGDDSSQVNGAIPADANAEASSDSAEPDAVAGDFLTEQYHVSDADLDAHGLRRVDARFLGLVHSAMEDDIPHYSLLTPMTNLPLYKEADVDALRDQGLLEQTNIGPRQYFTVTPDGRDFLNVTRTTGPQHGDLGEKTPHIVGVRLLATYFEQFDVIDRTELYYEAESSDAVFDVAGFSTDRDHPVWVGEVETATNNRVSIRHDYEKMVTSPAIGTWVVDTKETLKTVITSLEQGDVSFDGSLKFDHNPSYEETRSQLAEIDDSGFSRVYGLTELFREVD